ncbi:MAG TPA: integrase core domain-containing protein [Aggregatilineaceae bacterium]|nr:integrase core domain-containing protein [Aggregatilineaceae bacterium]
MGEGPRFLTCDNDGKFGDQFKRVAESTGIDVIHTLIEAPKTNAHCERFIGSVRRELLDHSLILSDGHLHRKVTTYVQYFNRARPHQDIRCTACSYDSLVSFPAHSDSGWLAS